MKNDSTTPATITTLPDGALAITVGAWSLRAETAEDEARVRDVDLAERLGYERPRTIRGLIARLESDGKLKDLHRAPRRSAGLMRGPAATEIVVEEYWLTEAQALKVVAKSETDKADALLDEVIAVYMAVRRGMVPRAAPQPEASPLLAQFVETLQAMQGQIETLSAEVATLRAAGQGRTCLGNGAARLHVLDPLKQIAAIDSRAIGKTDSKTLGRMQKLADDTLRERLAYPRDGGQAWAMFPTVRLGDLHCALVRMLHDARKRADIAAPRATQLRLVANENGSKKAS